MLGQHFHHYRSQESRHHRDVDVFIILHLPKNTASSSCPSHIPGYILFPTITLKQITSCRRPQKRTEELRPATKRGSGPNDSSYARTWIIAFICRYISSIVALKQPRTPCSILLFIATPAGCKLPEPYLVILQTISP